jgi:hypothetical protein
MSKFETVDEVRLRDQSPNLVGTLVLAIVAVAVLVLLILFLVTPRSDRGPRPVRPVIHAK